MNDGGPACKGKGYVLLMLFRTYILKQMLKKTLSKHSGNLMNVFRANVLRIYKRPMANRYQFNAVCHLDVARVSCRLCNCSPIRLRFIKDTLHCVIIPGKKSMHYGHRFQFRGKLCLEMVISDHWRSCTTSVMVE